LNCDIGMSKPLEEWLKARRTIRVMGLIQEHSEKALQVTDEFLHMVDASIANRQQDLDLAYKREELREREGDALRRKILEELARGELSPEEREYIMRLARQMDLVADYAHGAGRILTFLPLDRTDETLRQQIHEICNKTRDCVANLGQCIKELVQKDLNGAAYYVDIIEKLEEEVDELHMKTRRTLLGDYYSRVDPRIVSFLSEFFEAVEETSDRCEDCSDQIKVLIIYLSKPSS